MNEQQARERRLQLAGELRDSQRQMRVAVDEVGTQLRQSVSPAALARRARPLLPFVAVAAVGGWLLMRLGGRRLSLGLLLPMALQAWRVGRVLHQLASPPPRALTYKEQA